MRLLLQRDYRLLGWKGDPFYLAHRLTGATYRLTPSEFAFLLRCDGETEIEAEAWPPAPEWVLKEGIVAECHPGEKLLPRQEYRLFPNRKMDYVDLSVTGRCNLNCKHCFNARDCNPFTVEPTLDQMVSLLDQLADCGVCRIKLDGGEPLMRRDILTVTAEMAKRDIAVSEFLTNGTLLTPELLDALEAQGHHPYWYLSLDGLGYHDWLRGVPGTEEKTLKSIRLLCDRGYHVRVHLCVWKDNLPSIRPTVLRIMEMGVSRLRLLPVKPSLRWMATAKEQTVTEKEWLDFIPDFLDWWYENNIDMDLDIWGYWFGGKGSKCVTITPDLLSRGVDDRTMACFGYPNQVFIDADGRVIRCLALSGITAAYGAKCPNVYQGDDLRALMTESDFLNQMMCTCGDLKSRLPECQACSFRDRCGLGCRAQAMIQGETLWGVDRRMCRFFKEGYYDKFKAVAEKHGLQYA